MTGWTDEQKSDYSLSDWWDNVGNPSCDSDDFYINYIVHPYRGATYYVRASERGYDRRGAFWYSVLLSTMFEFGVGALFEAPSIQDLIITPTVGSLVGLAWAPHTQSEMGNGPHGPAGYAQPPGRQAIRLRNQPHVNPYILAKRPSGHAAPGRLTIVHGRKNA